MAKILKTALFQTFSPFKALLIITSLAIPLLLINRNIGYAIYSNLAHLSLNNALGNSEITWFERINDFEFYVRFLQKTLDFSEQNSNKNVLVGDVSEIKAFYKAEYYRYNNDLIEALKWYQVAIKEENSPIWQQALPEVYFHKLTPDGAILFEDFTHMGRWVPDTANNNVVNFQQIESEGLRLRYNNQPDQRDIIAYSYFSTPIFIKHHNQLVIRFKAEPTTYLTLEIRIDGEQKRLLNYHRGLGEWQELIFPLQGEIVDLIKMSISEPNASPTVDTYEIMFDSIMFVPDNS